MCDSEPMMMFCGLPVIVATELSAARELLADDTLRWTSGHTLCIDLALRHRRGDPFVVSDLDEAGWIERFTAPDPSLAPKGEELVQAHMPIRPGEGAEQAAARLERLLDGSLADWRERETCSGAPAAAGALAIPALPAMGCGALRVTTVTFGFTARLSWAVSRCVESQQLSTI